MNTYFKELGYNTINKTSKINQINHYLEIVKKAIDPLFEKYVFYINLNKVKSLDLRKQIKMMTNCNLDEDDIIVFINKDNYIHFSRIQHLFQELRLMNFLIFQMVNCTSALFV